MTAINLHPKSGFSPEEYAALSPDQKKETSRPSRSVLQPVKKESAVVVTTTWDGVRHWQNAAKMFEQGKLFAQVMIGFELLSLKKSHGVVNGNNQHEGRVSQNGKPTDDWETILQKEAGLSKSTAYRFMDMAVAAAPRLKKLPALKNFDPFTQPLAKLPAPQRQAMETAVKKLTDGKTQTDFFDDLYKTGGKGAGREPGCDNTRKTPTIAETAALLEKAALERMAGIDKALRALKSDFVNVRSDEPLIAFQASLEQTINAVKAWLKQPVTDRKPKQITEMFQ